MAAPIVLNDAAAAKIERRAEVVRVRLLDEITYNAPGSDWRDTLLARIQPNDAVLDVGKSTRDRFEAMRAKARLVHTLDINVFESYPDLLADICQPIPEAYHGHYDVVIALAVLECVYDPQAMIDNVWRMLKPGGRAHLYAPFLFQYHAPEDLSFQDNYRFSRDGLAYLLRGYVDVELAPVRGQYATIANLLPSWKRRIEPVLGPGFTRLLDRWADPRKSRLNASGYNITATKA